MENEIEGESVCAEAGSSEHLTDQASNPLQVLVDFFEARTKSGLFPVVAYGLDPQGEPNRLGLLTCSITDFPISLKTVEKIMKQVVTPGRFVPLQSLRYIGQSNKIMVTHDEAIEGLDSNLSEHRSLIGRLAKCCTASRWLNRAFCLVDIVGFSRYSTPEQLSLRLSLGHAINQCMQRIFRITCAKRDVVSYRGFERISTGDGFYIWSNDTSPEGHVSTFLLTVFLMAQTEAMHRFHGNPLRLRAAFSIGECYMFPYDGPGIPLGTGARTTVREDAIGPVLNQLNRLLKDAVPGQFVVAPFAQPGRNSRPLETLDVETMLTRLKHEILPAELDIHGSHTVKSQDIELRIEPNALYRICDKHEFVHHCYNVNGRVPNRFFEEQLRLQEIGVIPDSSPDLENSHFRTD